MKARLLRLFVFAGVAGPGAAQIVLHHYVESEPEARAGEAVAIWDDLSGDGLREWAIGVPFADTTVVDGGRVTVLSGADHSVYTTLEGTVASTSPRYTFGGALANVGDLDGDGVDELAVGSTVESSVHVYSGATQAVLWSYARADLDNLGYSVAAVGDVDGDGVGDVGAGATRADGGGAVVVLSSTGGLLYEFRSPTLGCLGVALCGIGDVDGDGFGEVVAGAPCTAVGFEGIAGAVVVLAGPNGVEIDRLLATGTPYNLRGQQFGQALAPLGDLDGDGTVDFAVGAPWYGWLHYIDDNYVAAFSGATRAEFWRTTGLPDKKFGWSLASAGDIDLDGHDDLLIGDPVEGRVNVWSVARDEELSSYRLVSESHFGTSVAGGLDVDGDGWLDFVGGAGYELASSIPPGEALLLTHGCWPEASYTYCVGAPNSAGAGARMAHSNSLSVAANDFELSVSNAPNSVFGLFFYGSSAIQAPFGDGFRCVGGMTFRLQPPQQTTPFGRATRPVDNTAPPAPAAQISAGSTWFFQFWYRDAPAGGSGFNVSDGLRATFCP